MNDMTEEQQAERLREWWRENGRAVLTGLALGVTLIVGWQGWDGYRQQRTEAGSDAFAQFRQASTDTETAAEPLITQGETLIREFDDTPYAALAALELAKRHVQTNNLDRAEARLRWVMDHADQPGLPELARLRLARVLIAADQADQALAELGAAPKGMAALYDETRGDALKAKGDLAGAAAAYDQALERLPEATQERIFLQMKRDNLGIG